MSSPTLRTFCAALACLALLLTTNSIAAQELAPETDTPSPAQHGQTTEATTQTPDAAADASAQKKATSSGSTASTDLSHAGQIGLAVLFGGGGLLRVVYDVDENPCNEDDPDNPVCTSAAPLFLDLELSFAITEGFELALPLRLALSAVDGEKPNMIIPLARLWPLEPSTFNLFFEVGIPVMFSPRTDVGAHFGIGLQIDINRMVGFRVGAFPDAFFADELRTNFNFGAGIQGRFLNW